ncbi:hypothetical protein UY3_12739 [Chelonia mydas]|uniref:Uncharacterized protein n=1 Tax=Chelonia mydas TaxID=8469 RepID=M7AXB5_CHEMY|nr:hypothetical protein UY3_12739 [Chelonia mydas]
MWPQLWGFGLRPPALAVQQQALVPSSSPWLQGPFRFEDSALNRNCVVTLMMGLQHGELTCTGHHAELIITGNHAVPELPKSSSMDRTGGVGHNTEVGFGGEEDDDEEEIVDSSQQASGETSFPNSQDLFITLDLDPVPPEPTHGGLPDPEGGDETSAVVQHMHRNPVMTVNIRPNLTAYIEITSCGSIHASESCNDSEYQAKRLLISGISGAASPTPSQFLLAGSADRGTGGQDANMSTWGVPHLQVSGLKPGIAPHDHRWCNHPSCQVGLVPGHLEGAPCSCHALLHQSPKFLGRVLGQ